MGFLSFVSIVVTELVGSPVMKNGSVIVGLGVGCVVAGAVGYIGESILLACSRSQPVCLCGPGDGDVSVRANDDTRLMVCGLDGSSIKTAPAITFLWVHRFKLGVYPPAILPMLAVYGASPPPPPPAAPFSSSHRPSAISSPPPPPPSPPSFTIPLPSAPDESRD